MADLVTQLKAAGCVFAEEEAAILFAAAPDTDALAELVARRISGEPLEHVVGWADFAGLRVPVVPGVFVPRRRTELVARIAQRLAPESGTVVDLCCGSGAIAMALATWRHDLTVIAADIDPLAVDLARRGLEPLGGMAVVSDMAAGLPEELTGSVDVVVSCPPYVPSRQIALMPHEAREWEPRKSLDGGKDGTRMQARVFAAAKNLLTAGGACVVETSEHLADATVAAATRVGFAAAVEEDESLDGVAVVGTL